MKIVIEDATKNIVAIASGKRTDFGYYGIGYTVKTLKSIDGYKTKIAEFRKKTRDGRRRNNLILDKTREMQGDTAEQELIDEGKLNSDGSLKK